MAFEVSTFSDDATSLEAADYPVIHDADLPGYSRCYTEDSFNNRVEILSPAKRPAL